MTKRTLEKLTAAVTEYVSKLRTQDRVSCCAWITSNKGRVARDWPKWVKIQWTDSKYQL